MFVGLLLKNWQLVVIGVLLLALAGTGIYAKVLKGNIATLEAEKASLVVKLEVSNASILALQKSIDEQNAAVQKFKTAADEREKASRSAIVKAKLEAGTLKKHAQDLMGRVIPQNVTSCDAANLLINEEIKNAK